MWRKRYGKQIDEAKKWIRSSGSVGAGHIRTKAANCVWTPGDDAKWSGGADGVQVQDYVEKGMVPNRYAFRSELRGRGATGQAKPKSFCVMADKKRGVQRMWMEV
jgi:hypothetical protein